MNNNTKHILFGSDRSDLLPNGSTRIFSLIFIDSSTSCRLQHWIPMFGKLQTIEQESFLNIVCATTTAAYFSGSNSNFLSLQTYTVCF